MHACKQGRTQGSKKARNKASLQASNRASKQREHKKTWTVGLLSTQYAVHPKKSQSPIVAPAFSQSSCGQELLSQLQQACLRFGAADPFSMHQPLQPKKLQFVALRPFATLVLPPLPQ
eukprot:2732373-Rhodomonas_salina.1